jgi:hypothetical protein
MASECDLNLLWLDSPTRTPLQFAYNHQVFRPLNVLECFHRSNTYPKLSFADVYPKDQHTLNVLVSSSTLPDVNGSRLFDLGFEIINRPSFIHSIEVKLHN